MGPFARGARRLSGVPFRVRSAIAAQGLEPGRGRRRMPRGPGLPVCGPTGQGAFPALPVGFGRAVWEGGLPPRGRVMPASRRGAPPGGKAL